MIITQDFGFVNTFFKFYYIYLKKWKICDRISCKRTTCEVITILIKILDREAMGEDTPFSPLYSLGEIEIYPSTSADELKERIADADIIILNKVKISKEAISTAKRLRLICTFATGYDNIDVAACRELGIAVCNVPAYSTDSVALMTVATVLSLRTHLIEYRDYVNSGEYTKSGVANKLTPVYHEISGSKWGIIGYGNIGKAVAKVAKALGAEVMFYQRTQSEVEGYSDIDKICSECDIITLHCPLNKESTGLIDKRRISLMKQGVILVNEARGAGLCERDVADAVLLGKIGGFGCDVYTEEPFSENHPYTELLGMKNVILTPHSAWASYEARVRCVNIICDNINAFLQGDFKNRVDK